MLQSLPLSITTAQAQARANGRTWLVGYSITVGIGLVIGLMGFGSLADPFALTLAMFVAGAAAILVKPMLGIYLIAFFALAGDAVTTPWYPFAKNFSSRESILFISDALTTNPLEIYLALTTLAWLVRLAGSRNWRIHGQPLLWPLLLFSVTLVVGLMYGVGSGGNLSIAIWEFRPVMYLPVMYVLASNLLTHPSHYTSLAWVTIAALTVQNVLAIQYYGDLGPAEKESLESLTEHGASVHIDWMLILLLSLWLIRGCSRLRLFLVLVAMVPATQVYILSQRRAAAVALLAGFTVFSLVLFFRRRRAFFVLVPIVFVATAAYTAAFWNSEAAGGFGAQAVKSVIAPGQTSAEDASSDLYRAIEKYDLVFTVKAKPVTGVGFGQPFFRPIPLPNISFFVFYEYIPHNSILWIWLKTGYVGFVTLLFVVASTLRLGIRAALRSPTGDHLAVTIAALAYVVMYTVFAYVDIAWEARSTVFLGICMATCANMERVRGPAALNDEAVRHRT